MSKPKTIISEIQSAHTRMIRAVCDAEYALGQITNLIEKFESLKPVYERIDFPEGAVFTFRRDDLILAGVDISKWTKATS